MEAKLLWVFPVFPFLSAGCISSLHPSFDECVPSPPDFLVSSNDFFSETQIFLVTLVQFTHQACGSCTPGRSMSRGMVIHRRSFYLWVWKWPDPQLLWPGTSPTHSYGSEVFYTSLKRWFIQKDHEILYRRRAKGHFACGWCVASSALLCLSLLLDLLSLQANLLEASYLGNLLFITQCVSIHIFTRLELYGK